MRDKYIPAFIMLLAGAITSFINIVNKIDVYTSLKRLLLVLVVFYIVGLITRRLLLKITMVKKTSKNEDAESDAQISEDTDKKVDMDNPGQEEEDIMLGDN